MTHRAPTSGEWSPRVTFVTEGVDPALELAQDASGERVVATRSCWSRRESSCRTASPTCRTAWCAT